MSDNIFYDVDQVDWVSFGFEQTPSWFYGLTSTEQSVRDTSFDELIGSNIYNRPSFALAVIPYILRILEYQDVNTETELLIEFLAAMRSYARGHRSRGNAIKNSEAVINVIENSIDILKMLLATRH